MQFIKNVLFKQKGPEFDIEKAVGKYLIELPRCSGKVKVISQEDKGPCYNCVVTVGSDRLLSWAEEHSKAVWSSHNEEQAARIALPLWLRGADLSDQTVTELPFYMREIVIPTTAHYIDDGSATVFCYDCDADVEDITISQSDCCKSGQWRSWRIKWVCPQGHELHNMQHDIKIC